MSDIEDLATRMMIAFIDQEIDVEDADSHNPVTWEQFKTAAEDILAAGFHRDRTITTADELGELPDESVVLGIDHSLWHREGCWWDQKGHPASSNPVIEEHGPVTVLYEGARDE